MSEILTQNISKTETQAVAVNQVILAVVLSALSGLMFYLAFPPINFWPLIFFALTPYLVAQSRLMPLKWAPVAPTIAMLVWLWPFLYRIFDVPGAPFLFQNMGLLVGIITLLTSSERKFNQLTGFRWFILQGMAGWVGFEMIRSFIPVLGTMGFVANPLAGQAWLIQPVSIFSIYGLNLLVILVNFTLAQVIMHWMDRNWPSAQTVAVDGKATRRWAWGSLIAVVTWVALSLVLFNQSPAQPQTIRVAALQMNLKDPGHQVDEAGQAERMELLGTQMREAAAQGAVVGYVPEMAFGFNPQEKYTAELQALTAETNLYLYFTYAYHEESGWHNETVLIDPDGKIFPIYGKQHAFGEPPTVSAGVFPIHQTPYGKMGAIICMDGVFTDSARKTALAGAQILANPSYNSTVGISEQNWTHFVFRSVENQVPVVNADRGYYTMITGTHGEILADVRTPAGANAVVVADVPLAQANSLYTHVGDWMGWVSLAGFVFFMIFQSRVESQAKKANKAE